MQENLDDSPLDYLQSSETIDQEEEWKRIKSKLNNLSKRKCIISLDTRKSFIIKKSLPYKVSLINDVSGLSYDKDTIEILKKSKIPFVIHHMQGTPKTMQIKPNYKNVLLDIYDFFEEKLKLIRKKNIKHNNIILDPGIGFGKTIQHNDQILLNLNEFKHFNCKILIGISRKSFLSIDFDEPSERLEQSIGVGALSAFFGADIIRVHDVNKTYKMLKIINRLKSYG